MLAPRCAATHGLAAAEEDAPWLAHPKRRLSSGMMERGRPGTTRDGDDRRVECFSPDVSTSRPVGGALLPSNNPVRPLRKEIFRDFSFSSLGIHTMDQMVQIPQGP